MAVTQWFSIELPGQDDPVEMTREQVQSLFVELGHALGYSAQQPAIQSWPAEEEAVESVMDVDRKLAAQQAMAAAPSRSSVPHMSRAIGVRAV